jgi:predicted aspartyl protease
MGMARPWKARVGRTLRLLIGALALLQSVPAGSETIPLERHHGTYVISVQINETLVLPFVLDTGASLVVLPADVFRTLTRTGTVTSADFIGTGTAVLADGSKRDSEKYVLHEVRVGDHVVRNVIASVVSASGDPLLGQTFLSKLPAWAIDNARQALVIGGGTAQGSPAVPMASSPVGHYGAIAWDMKTGRSGSSWNGDTPDQAAEMALRECGTNDCEIIIRTRQATCAALATTENGKYAGGASRRDREAARLAALANCQKGNAGNCIIRITDCNH